MKSLMFFLMASALSFLVIGYYFILVNSGANALDRNNGVPTMVVDSPLVTTPLQNTRGTSSPRRDSIVSSNDFAACLLVLDENHRLTEWLAYHYYMINLRHVVLLVDPASISSPRDVTERWNSLIEFHIWSDETIGFSNNTTTINLSGKAKGRRYQDKDQSQRIQVHRLRQRFFYKKCAQHLRSEKRNWVAFYDVDEYIYLDPDEIPDAKERIQQPGCIVKFIKEMQSSSAASQTIKLPIPYRNSAKLGCVMVPRTYFGATERNTAQTRRQHQVPSYLNGTDFETLRWIHRTSHDDFENNGRGKSLLHVSAISSIDTVGDRGVHSLVKSCKAPRADHSPLRLRHYLGSWDVYSSRAADPRKGGFRSLQHYQYRAELGKDLPEDDNVWPWLIGFCSLLKHNKTLIRQLFHGTGRVKAPIQGIEKAQWSLSHSQISDLVQGKQADKPNTFPNWLRAHYRVVNGTGTEVIRIE